MKGTAIFNELRTVIFRVTSSARFLPDEAHADTRQEMGLRLGHWENVEFVGGEWRTVVSKPIPIYKPIAEKEPEPQPETKIEPQPEPEFDLFE